MIDVIIPSKTSAQFAQLASNCIASLRQSEQRQFNVVVVESEHETHPFNVGQDKTIFWDPERKFNYNGALNLGIRATTNEWVVLTNNDVIFHPGWFTEILKVNAKHPDLMSFCSWCDYDNWHPSRYPNLAPDVDHVINDWIGYGMASWTIIVKREVLNVIDLSERVSFWYSDNVYADAVKKHGYKHALAVHSKIDHLSSQTIKTIAYNSAEDKCVYSKGTR